jgi:hypothetical protein
VDRGSGGERGAALRIEVRSDLADEVLAFQASPAEPRSRTDGEPSATECDFNDRFVLP